MAAFDQEQAIARMNDLRWIVWDSDPASREVEEAGKEAAALQHEAAQHGLQFKLCPVSGFRLEPMEET